VQALVFVGDALEENPDKLSQDAGELGRLRVSARMFQEGHDRDVEQVFRGIARLTHGAYSRFDPGAAHELAELLRAVAVYAAGGMTALAARRDVGAVKLLQPDEISRRCSPATLESLISVASQAGELFERSLS
jgi:hypothetical protein